MPTQVSDWLILGSPSSASATALFLTDSTADSAWHAASHRVAPILLFEFRVVAPGAALIALSSPDLGLSFC